MSGLDLVGWQLRIAQDEPLDLSNTVLQGHGVEVRLYAEDPRSFLPQAGQIERLRLPSSIRVDAGVEEGDEIGTAYDPMIAKLIAHAETRAAALEQLRDALAETEVEGVVTNLPFLRHLAGKRRPLIVSTGMSTLDEVAEAVTAIREAGDPPIALLHCVSSYPAPVEETNLRAMDTLSARFGCPVGLSDHTTGIDIAIAAVARGATIVEKHVTLDKGLPGPDHRASLDPEELASLLGAIRRVEAALGDGNKRPKPSEADTRRVARKSLVAARPIRAGERLTRDLIAIKRPGTGISPAELDRALGRVVVRALAGDDVIDWAALGDA